MGGMQWKTLLVPHDFSAAAARAFGLATDLAALTGGRVALLHVSPIPHGLRPDSRILPDDAEAPVRIDEHMTAAARRKLEALVAERGAQASVTAVASELDPAEVILAKADELRADVIVMGTHGRTGVRRLLVGSVAERVLRHAGMPVVVVRDPDLADEHLREEDAVRDEEEG